MSGNHLAKFDASANWDGIFVEAFIAAAEQINREDSPSKTFSCGCNSLGNNDSYSDNNSNKPFNFTSSTMKQNSIASPVNVTAKYFPKSKAQMNLENSGMEKFPDLAVPKTFPPKQKSMTEAELKAEVISDKDVAAVSDQLKNQPAPLSLEQARSRRASIKEENMDIRKRSVEFIRRRTTSRTTISSRPLFDIPFELQQERKD